MWKQPVAVWFLFSFLSFFLPFYYVRVCLSAGVVASLVRFVVYTFAIVRKEESRGLIGY
jgi:hypothetical protein